MRSIPVETLVFTYNSYYSLLNRKYEEKDEYNNLRKYYKFLLFLINNKKTAMSIIKSGKNKRKRKNLLNKFSDEKLVLLASAMAELLLPRLNRPPKDGDKFSNNLNNCNYRRSEIFEFVKKSRNVIKIQSLIRMLICKLKYKRRTLKLSK